MAKRPSKVKVGPFDVSIVFGGSHMEHSDSSGLFEGRKLRITVDKDVTPDVQRHILIHEIMHACIFVTDEPEQKDEESYIRCISGVFYGVLKENPQLVAWLLDKD